jgi:methionyl-tRNA formyltransferase
VVNQTKLVCFRYLILRGPAFKRSVTVLGNFIAMQHRLILLADKAFFLDMQTSMSDVKGAPSLALASTLVELTDHLLASSTRTRVISFGSGVIVPADVLKLCNGGAYNFHPGPPNYRGLFPSVYALYDNAETFGVTCHEMSDTVDSGAIVAVQRFLITPSHNRETLDGATYAAMLELLRSLAPALANVSAPLPHAPETWSGPLRSRKDFDALCALPGDVTDAEFQRRYRAIGEGPDHAISIKMFGQRFRLDNQRTQTVVKGGQPI